jgi:hypothetical protein
LPTSKIHPIGDGWFNSYEIVSKEKNQNDQCTLTTIELFEDPNRKGEKTLIFIEKIDDDKTFWTFGDGPNPYRSTFLKNQFADNYPRRKNDCSEFEKEYSNHN